VVFNVALDWKHIDNDQCVRWSANLIGAGHGYLGVSGPMLAHAARMDAQAGNAPGDLFTTISAMIGGWAAEPVSPTHVVLGCLRDLWEDQKTVGFREPVNGVPPPSARAGTE
jgi:hypothetical protein